MKCSKCLNDATLIVTSAIFPGLRWGYCDAHKPPPKGFAPRPRPLTDTGRRPGEWDGTAKTLSFPCIVPGPEGKPLKALWALQDWHIEDMVYPKHTAMVMASGCDFLPWMKRLASKHDFTVCEFSFESLGWNRDPVLRTLHGPSLFHEADSPGMGGKRVLKANAKSQSPALVPDVMFNGIRCAPDVRKLVLEEELGFGTHDIPVAGGNVIAARSKDNQLKFIVGELGLYSTWHLEAFGSKLDITQAQYGKAALAQRAAKAGYDPEQYLLWKNAKERIRKILLDRTTAEQEWSATTQKKRVLFVPQWAYHIDVQMLYVGHGRIALHSFQKQLELVQSLYLKASAEKTRLLDAISALQTAYGPVTARAKEILVKHGFEVIDVAGSFPLKVANGHLDQNVPDSRLYFNFLNGLALFPNKVMVLHNVDQEHQLIELAYELFQEQLGEAGIEVVPIGSHVSLGGGARPHRFDVNDFMYRQGGGLRCKTTTLPTSYVDKLQPVTEELKRKALEAARIQREMREQAQREAQLEKNALVTNALEELKTLGLWYDDIDVASVTTIIKQGHLKDVIKALTTLKEEGAPSDVMNEALEGM
ncbi:hypothetical protein, partial [Corallococcus llansteffanensis]